MKYAQSRHMKPNETRDHGIKTMLLIVAVGFWGWMAGTIGVLVRNEAFNPAENALLETGLSAPSAPYYSLYGFTGWRDSFSETKFTVPYRSERESLWAEIAASESWRVAELTADEYMLFQQTCMWECASVDLPPDVVFDAWYYRETNAPAGREPTAPNGALSEIGQVGRGFVLAAYDLESGLFLLVRQFG